MECTQSQNKKNCNCTYDCPKKGHCCDCIAFHRNRNELPACYFSQTAEKTYDRSIEAFIEDYNRNK